MNVGGSLVGNANLVLAMSLIDMIYKVRYIMFDLYLYIVL